MNKLLILIASITFLSSCTKKKPIIYENDTDFTEWINQQTVKDAANAHSGTSSSIIDSIHPYSLGFSKAIENIGPKFKQIRVSYWAFLKSDRASATTVLSIDFNGKNVNWEGHPIKIVETNKWVPVNETFSLPANAKPNNQLSGYVWNTSKEEILIDDLKFEFK